MLRVFLSGYPDGTFGLNQPITRLEVLVALTNGLGLQSTANPDTLLATFVDRGQIPNWAKGAIATATDRQLIVNYPNVNQLNPSRYASRAEIVAITYQALVNARRATAISSPYLVVVGTPSVGTPSVGTPFCRNALSADFSTPCG